MSWIASFTMLLVMKSDYDDSIAYIIRDIEGVDVSNTFSLIISAVSVLWFWSAVRSLLLESAYSSPTIFETNAFKLSLSTDVPFYDAIDSIAVLSSDLEIVPLIDSFKWYIIFSTAGLV